MRGKGVLRDHSQPRTCSGKKTPKSCLSKGNLDNFVFIDVDDEGFDNVINIDVPESLQQKLQGSHTLKKERKFPFRGIISIDDDLDSDATLSKSCPASDYMQNHVDSDGDECEVILEKKAPFKLSKCRKTHSLRKANCRNHYGLYPESGRGSSKSDFSDCELMEGSFEELREQWEKAFFKRKGNVRNGQLSLEDQVGALGSKNDTHPTTEVENRTKQPSKASAFSVSSSANFEKGNPSAFVATGDGCLGSTSLNPGMESPFVESAQNGDQESFSWLKPGSKIQKTQSSLKKADVKFRGPTATQDSHLSYAEWQCHQNVNGVDTSFGDKEQCPQGPSFRSDHDQGGIQRYCTRTCFQDKEQSSVGEHCFSNGQPRHNIHFDHRKATAQDEYASLCKCQHSGETHFNTVRVVSSNKDEEDSRVPSSCNTSPRKSQNKRTGFVDKEELVSSEPLVSDTRLCEETWVESGEVPSKDKVGAVSEELVVFNIFSRGISIVSDEKEGHHKTEKPNSKEASLSSTQCNETQIKQGGSGLAEAKEPSSGSTISLLYDNRVPLNVQCKGVTAAVEMDIINEREKLKETDEYKRAVEEEWASRQRQLQIQAEEAQRLRKRRRAESMRILDMERRQKQRVEEMRETQKKDEENMNLKEQLRAEIRNELYKLEITCIDMASLLGGLGIHVGGDFYDVHAAYKRALLKFHPDRASRTDIRQQVEAEEKFKLISRMKEKFLLTSWQ